MPDSEKDAAAMEAIAKTSELFGVQNSCYFKLKRTADWQRRSRSKDSDQGGHRSHVADRIQTTDTVKPATEYLRKASGQGYSGH